MNEDGNCMCEKGQITAKSFQNQFEPGGTTKAPPKKMAALRLCFTILSSLQDKEAEKKLINPKKWVPNE